MLGSRILILAPHPDDEVVGCAAAIGRAQAQGCRVFTLALTTGVPAADRLWPWQRRRHPRRVARRLAEAEQVARRLEVTALGALAWPSRSLCRHLDRAAAAVEQALSEHRIDMLWVPAYEGGHQDHDAANAVGSLFAETLAVWEFAEYNLAGGRVQSQRFPEGDDGATILALDAEERRRKALLLRGYASERINLLHVGTERESFRPLRRRDYAQPPHPGPLFRERFAWVPFPHPSLDRTPSAEIRTALTDWLAAAGAKVTPRV